MKNSVIRWCIFAAKRESSKVGQITDASDQSSEFSQSSSFESLRNATAADQKTDMGYRMPAMQPFYFEERFPC
jgi:hypothetical protein